MTNSTSKAVQFLGQEGFKKFSLSDGDDYVLNALKENKVPVNINLSSCCFLCRFN